MFTKKILLNFFLTTIIGTTVGLSAAGSSGYQPGSSSSSGAFPGMTENPYPCDPNGYMQQVQAHPLLDGPFYSGIPGASSSSTDGMFPITEGQSAANYGHPILHPGAMPADQSADCAYPTSNPLHAPQLHQPADGSLDSAITAGVSGSRSSRIANKRIAQSNSAPLLRTEIRSLCTLAGNPSPVVAELDGDHFILRDGQKMGKISVDEVRRISDQEKESYCVVPYHAPHSGMSSSELFGKLVGTKDRYCFIFVAECSPIEQLRSLLSNNLKDIFNTDSINKSFIQFYAFLDNFEDFLNLNSENHRRIIDDALFIFGNTELEKHRSIFENMFLSFITDPNFFEDTNMLLSRSEEIYGNDWPYDIQNFDDLHNMINFFKKIILRYDLSEELYSIFDRFSKRNRFAKFNILFKMGLVDSLQLRFETEEERNEAYERLEKTVTEVGKKYQIDRID